MYLKMKISKTAKSQGFPKHLKLKGKLVCSLFFLILLLNQSRYYNQLHRIKKSNIPTE